MSSGTSWRGKSCTPRRSPGASAVALGRRSGSVLVVAAEPVQWRVVRALLVPSARGAVEPLVHAPETVQPAGIGGVGVVDDAVLEREGAHARRLARVGGPVGPGGGGPVGERSLGRGLGRRHELHDAEVVLTGAGSLLLLGEADPEVVVEVAAERRRPRER